MERLQPRRTSRRRHRRQRRRAVALLRVKVGGRGEVVGGHAALAPAAPAHVLLALEAPRAVRVRAHGVPDEEQVVDRERELLVAQRPLGQQQAREELGRVAEQRAVLVVQRRVRHMRVHVHVVHPADTDTDAPTTPATATSAHGTSTSTRTCATPGAARAAAAAAAATAATVLDGRGAPRVCRVRCRTRHRVRAVARGAGALPDVLQLVVRAVWCLERAAAVVEDAVFEVGRAARVVVLVGVVADARPRASEARGGLRRGRPAAYEGASVGGRRNQNNGQECLCHG